MTIEPARPGDLEAVTRILMHHGLPLEGVREQLSTMVVARDNGTVIGSAALEVYEDGALLRSVAVAPGREGAGLGRALTEAALRLAVERRAAAVFLLTTTAEQYFPRFGFVRIERANVPATVQQSIEFRSACPSSAIVMRKPL